MTSERLYSDKQFLNARREKYENFKKLVFWATLISMATVFLVVIPAIL